jgi:hypothetical protein
MNVTRNVRGGTSLRVQNVDDLFEQVKSMVGILQNHQ